MTTMTQGGTLIEEPKQPQFVAPSLIWVATLPRNTIASTGEKIEVRRFTRFTLGAD